MNNHPTPATFAAVAKNAVTIAKTHRDNNTSPFADWAVWKEAKGAMPTKIRTAYHTARDIAQTINPDYCSDFDSVLPEGVVIAMHWQGLLNHQMPVVREFARIIASLAYLDFIQQDSD